MGLGVALVVAVLVVYGVVYQLFNRGGEGYDLIVGAKGGKEQLVLNTVFYLSQPVGNIPYSFYDELTEGKFNRGRLNGVIEAAIPVCMGHTYQGFRVVGTVPEMFTKLKYRGDQSYQFAEGQNFKAREPFRRGARRGGRRQDAAADRRDFSGGSRWRRRRSPQGRVPRRGHPGPHRDAGRPRGFRQHAGFRDTTTEDRRTMREREIAGRGR